MHIPNIFTYRSQPKLCTSQTDEQNVLFSDDESEFSLLEPMRISEECSAEENPTVS